MFDGIVEVKYGKGADDMAEKVTITAEEYKSLKVTAAHMEMLDAMGVDNWGGYFGPYNGCEKCGSYDNSWAEEKCTKCGEVLPEPGFY